MLNKYFYNWFLILLSMLFITSFLLAKDRVLESKNDNTSSSPTGGGIILYSESFEGGSLSPWVSADDNSIPPQWHLSDWMAYGSSGMSWRMADPTLGTNGGYDNSWYQVLDTDPIALSGTGLQLTFYQRYSVESPGGEPAGYDGWDGVNVRISTDGGTTWSVLLNPTPAYSVTSLYSFGFEHNEGTGVPGWTGTQSTWSLATFDLSAYAGQSVKIRFAFGSDPGYSTADGAPALFGWQVDDILVTNSSTTLFSNDGTLSQMTATNNVPAAADLWKIVANDASDGTYYASCNNSSNTYEPNMTNSFRSDWFNLNQYSTNIYMDFDLRGTWNDNNTFPNVDFFGAYVQVEGESGLRFVSNITGDPGGSNFVYSSAPATWLAFSASYSVGVIDLTPLKGENIRIIIIFYSDGDAPIGEAIQVDNFQVWTDELVPVELTSFSANVNNEGHVSLNWSTATELNNQLFEIERRTEESQFVMIGFVEGRGTTSDAQEYSYLDRTVETGTYFYRLKQIDFDGRNEYSNVIEVEVFGPLAFGLEQNYPNPFNPTTNIKYSVSNSGYVKLAVYSMIGEEVSVLVDGQVESGFYEVNFDATNLPSGAYFYRLTSANSVEMKKMLLMK